MSVRAYRVIKKELADFSFNLWHDTDIVEFLEKGYGFFGTLDPFGGGKMEVPVSRLKDLLAEYPWESKDERKLAILSDIAWAEKNHEDFVEYHCF